MIIISHVVAKLLIVSRMSKLDCLTIWIVDLRPADLVSLHFFLLQSSWKLPVNHWIHLSNVIYHMGNLPLLWWSFIFRKHVVMMSNWYFYLVCHIYASQCHTHVYWASTANEHHHTCT